MEKNGDKIVSELKNVRFFFVCLTFIHPSVQLLRAYFWRYVCVVCFIFVSLNQTEFQGSVIQLQVRLRVNDTSDA